ncbi:Crp/Fnr family transcriptional regulator [Alcanivorax sp. S71-1-4]|jgi:CRP/FNR family transcriptional regulator, cyclic AMP receptor protein|uniref:cyclic nucleotide-binding domain-containing protein n=1 Tax=Alcanivorax sp. S71-1-4 TaxID=1177159 RepID=UPI001358D15B|nr:cyclic nucleotide-binding domain-containing protein [Alcanivorax sp. S71-1-4]KAF0809284.1 Crp/Fnr family transcriptional regulator [Alcanivorax sp. S71-1-4]
MLSIVEPTSGFSALVRQYKRLARELMQDLPLDGEPLHLAATDNAFTHGMDPSRTYLIKGGMLGMECQRRRLLTWDEGDLVLPDASGEGIRYHADSAVLLLGFDTLALVRTLLRDEQRARLWTQLLMTQQGMLVRLLAAQIEEGPHTTPGFAYFQPGDEIIRQGDNADYVFSLFEGEADVLVDNVVVGHVSEGEVLGALALLTQSPRTATVRANTRCAVVKVPKDQFRQLIRSNPSMIHGLLTDMARQIVQLNNQVVALSG